MSEANTQANRKERVGVVESAKQDKTIVVRVEQRYSHPLYKKVITRSKKLYAHDEANEANQGDTVRIRESRPLSKLKRWRLVQVVQRTESDD